MKIYSAQKLDANFSTGEVRDQTGRVLLIVQPDHPDFVAALRGFSDSDAERVGADETQAEEEARTEGYEAGAEDGYARGFADGQAEERPGAD
jgi:flagellar biosynthesis/type III secretory pathway protein FliH